jgi:hypothetical protein
LILFGPLLELSRPRECDPGRIKRPKRPAQARCQMSPAVQSQKRSHVDRIGDPKPAGALSNVRLRARSGRRGKQREVEVSALSVSGQAVDSSSVLRPAATYVRQCNVGDEKRKIGSNQMVDLGRRAWWACHLHFLCCGHGLHSKIWIVAGRPCHESLEEPSAAPNTDRLLDQSRPWI